MSPPGEMHSEFLARWQLRVRAPVGDDMDSLARQELVHQLARQRSMGRLNEWVTSTLLESIKHQLFSSSPQKAMLIERVVHPAQPEKPKQGATHQSEVVQEIPQEPVRQGEGASAPSGGESMAAPEQRQAPPARGKGLRVMG